MYPRQVFFIFVFSVFIFLLFLLGDTYLSYYLIGFYLIFISFYFKSLDKKYSVNFIFLLFLLVSFFLINLFSSLKGLSFPLSLNNLVYLLFFIINFIFIYSLPKFFLKKEILLILLLETSIVMCLFNIFFLFFPQLGNLLPGRNMVFSSYGHSHLSSLLLLVLPVSYWIYFQKKEKKYLFLVIFFIINLFLTFARVAILLMCLQLGLIVYFYKDKLFFSKKIKLIFSLLGLIFIVSVIFSFLIPKDSYFCQTKLSFVDKICKPFVADSRKFYWQQAWQGFLDKWIIGSGPGTFGIISTKYKQIPDYYSAQAHNMFLEQFITTGILGGSVYLFFFVCLFVLIKPNKNDLKNFSFRACLFLALLTSTIEAFFDFNWVLNSIFFIVITYCAFLLKNYENELKFLLKNFKIIKIKLITIYKFFFYILLSILFLYLLVDLALVFKKDDFAFELFPYFNNHRLIFSRSKKLTLEQQKKLDEIYKNNSIYLLERLNGDISYEAEIQYLKYLYEIDPWQMLDQDLVTKYFMNNDLKLAQDSLLEIDKFLNLKKEKYGFYKESLPSSYKEKLAFYFLFFARENYNQRNYLLAANFIVKAQYYENWSISKPLGWMFNSSDNLSKNEEIEIVKILSHIPFKYWGDNRLSYANFLESTLKNLSGEDISYLAASLSKDYPDYFEDNELKFLRSVYYKAISIKTNVSQQKEYQKEFNKLKEF